MAIEAMHLNETNRGFGHKSDQHSWKAGFLAFLERTLDYYDNGVLSGNATRPQPHLRFPIPKECLNSLQLALGTVAASVLYNTASQVISKRLPARLAH